MIEFLIIFRGAELYAQNPNLIKKDENRVRIDQNDQEHNRQSTLPSLMNTPDAFTFKSCSISDL